MIHLLYQNRSPEIARLVEQLRMYFGDKRVSPHCDAASAAEDRVQEIEEVLGVSGGTETCFICLIGSASESGGIELTDSNAVEYSGLSLALRSERVVVPVLLGDTLMPAGETLPAELRKLAYCHALPLRSGENFNSDFGRILNDLIEHTGYQRREFGAWGTWLIAIAIPLLLLTSPYLINWYIDINYWNFGYETVDQLNRSRSAYCIETPSAATLALVLLAVGFRLRLKRKNSLEQTRYLRAERPNEPKLLNPWFNLSTPLLLSGLAAGFWTLPLGILFAASGMIRRHGEKLWPQVLLGVLGALGCIAGISREKQFTQLADAVQLFEEGTQSLVRSEMVEAEELYKDALQTFPRFANAHLGLARVYKLQKNTEHALFELNRAIELYPTYSRGWFDPHHMMIAEAYEHRAELMDLLGNPEAAKEDRGMATAMNPMFDFFSGLGRYWQVSQTKEYERYSNTLNSESASSLP